MTFQPLTCRNRYSQAHTPVEECAPRSQPVVTGHDTRTVHALSMRRGEEKEQGVSTATVEPLPELRPWREVGWIFRDGSSIVIERKGDETHARVLGE